MCFSRHLFQSKLLQYDQYESGSYKEHSGSMTGKDMHRSSVGFYGHVVFCVWRLLSGGRHGRRGGSPEVEQVVVVSAVRAAARRRHLERVHRRLAVVTEREQPPVDVFLLARGYVAVVQFARYITGTVVSETKQKDGFFRLALSERFISHVVTLLVLNISLF